MQIVSHAQAPEESSAATRHARASLNWGWIALGGCLGVLLALSPFIISILGMVIWAIGDEAKQDARHAEATARVVAAYPPTPVPPPCMDAPPEIVATIESRLTLPGIRLVDAQAMQAEPHYLIIAARVDGVDRSVGGDNTGVWTVQAEGSVLSGTPESAVRIGAINRMAAQAGPFTRSAAGRRWAAAAVDCVETPAWLR